MTAEEQGVLLVRFDGAVRTVRNGEPALERYKGTQILAPSAAGIGLYCGSCNGRRLYTSADALLDAIGQGKDWITLEHEGFMVDPLGVLRRRTAHRSAVLP